MLSKVLIALILGIIPTITFSQEKVLRFDHITVEDGLSQNTVQGIVQDKYGFMWFGTWEGLCKYDGYKFTIYRTEVGNHRTIHNNLIRMLYKDDKDNIWVSCVDTMISRYNYDSDDFTRFSKKELPKWLLDSLDRTKSIHFTFIKTTNYLWYVYEQNNPLSKNLALNQINNSLTQTNRMNGNQINYRFDPFDNRALNDEFVYNIYLDNNGILWVGTYSGGVNKADTRQKQFFHYNKEVNKSSLIDNMVRAICEDKEGNLWVGTHSKGITKIDQKNDAVTHYQHDDKKNSINTNHIRKIYCDRFGYIWIATKDGLDRYNPTTNHFRHYSFPPKPNIPANWVYWIMEDHNGYLWVGTWGGLAKYDWKNDKFLIYDPLKTLKRNTVRGKLEDRHYNLWISTEGGGLTRMQRDSSNGFEEKLIPTHFLHSPYNNNSLIDNRIYVMLEDENGIFWLGTSMGLDRFDPIKGTFRHFTSKNLLPDDLIIGLLCDYNGHIWISHKKGLTKIDTKTFAVRNYTKQDGLLGDEFSENACYRSPKTGKMFFGGVNGINYFFPDSIQENPIPPKIVFTDLQISNKSVSLQEKFNGQVVLDKPLYLSKEIKLTYLEKSIAIEFAALHYTNPKNNKYAYMLEGFDKDWIKTDASKRTAIYSNLMPNTYTFKVKASNCDGLWTSDPAILKIVVLPAWWQKWWFRLIVLLAIIASIYFVYYLKIALYKKKQHELTILVKKRTVELEHSNQLLLSNQKLIQRQAEKLQETNKELSVLNSTKDRFFSIIAHDLRNPFHVVKGFSEIILRDLENLPQEKLRNFISLIHTSSTIGNNLLENLLQWSRAQTGHIAFTPTKLNLAIVANETILLLEGEAHQKNIKINQLIEPNIIVSADENMIQTIFRNLISNALKFSHKNGTITIKSAIYQNKVEVTVADTGVGIPPENLALLFRIDATVTTSGTSNEPGTGLGLILCKEFAERHNGKIWVESEVGKGSEFKFTLPLV